MELDTEAVLPVTLITAEHVVVHVRVAVDDGRVRPEDGEERSDEPAVSHGALDGVVELAHLVVEVAHLTELAWSEAVVDEGVVVGDHVASHVAQHEDVAGVAPGAVGRSEGLVVTLEGQAKVVDRARHLSVAHGASNIVGVQDEMELVVQDARSLDAEAVDLLHADSLEVAKLVEAGEIGSDQILLVQDLHVSFFESLRIAFLLIQLHAGVEDRVVLHVEEFLVVGLESILDNTNGSDRVTIDLVADHILSKSKGVDAANSDALGLGVWLRTLLLGLSNGSNVAQIIVPFGSGPRSRRQRTSLHLRARDCL